MPAISFATNVNRYSKVSLAACVFVCAHAPLGQRYRPDVITVHGGSGRNTVMFCAPEGGFLNSAPTYSVSC